MTKFQAKVAPLPGLTIDGPRNEDVPRLFQTMYRAQAVADTEFMTPSPAFNSEFAKTSVRVVALILATLPLVAFFVLTAKVIF